MIKINKQMYNIYEYIKQLAIYLWKSFTSIEFYKDIYYNYSGYGFRYVFTLSFLSSIISGLFILYFLNSNIQALESNEKENNTSILIEKIISQWPVLIYDGNNLKASDENFNKYLKLDNIKLALFDFDNKASFNEKKDNILLFQAGHLLVNLRALTQENPVDSQNIPIKYEYIFGKEANIIDAVFLKNLIINNFKLTEKIFNYYTFPLIWIQSLLKTFNIGLILLIYLLGKAFLPRINVKTSIRLNFFASGLSLVINPLKFLSFCILNKYIYDIFLTILDILAIIPFILLFLALQEIRKEKINI